MTIPKTRAAFVPGIVIVVVIGSGTPRIDAQSVTPIGCREGEGLKPGVMLTARRL